MNLTRNLDGEHNSVLPVDGNANFTANSHGFAADRRRGIAPPLNQINSLLVDGSRAGYLGISETQDAEMSDSAFGVDCHFCTHHRIWGAVHHLAERQPEFLGPTW